MGTQQQIKIHLIHEDEDIKELVNNSNKFDWDVVINEKPYYVVKIRGYYHTIGGKYGNNDLWAYPRYEEPTYKNLIQFDGDPVCWGIKYEPKNYIYNKYETGVRSSGSVIITRNGEDFCDLYPYAKGINYGIDYARCLIVKLRELPICVERIDFDKKIIGWRLSYENKIYEIESYVHSQACIILKPLFEVSNGYEKLKVEIWSDKIDWYPYDRSFLS